MTKYNVDRVLNIHASIAYEMNEEEKKPSDELMSNSNEIETDF